jgi:hypothetical protein
MPQLLVDWKRSASADKTGGAAVGVTCETHTAEAAQASV